LENRLYQLIILFWEALDLQDGRDNFWSYLWIGSMIAM
jgi:hypothetical protein